MTRQVPDVLVVGGGTAGCILASRLSEDPSLRVMLLEAGRDLPPGDVPADVADVFPRSYANPEYFWPSLVARHRVGTTPIPFSQPRIIGGGSSVMGMWALRGLREDYEAWVAAGASGWGFHDVLPYFAKLENGSGPGAPDNYGTSGRVPIARSPRHEWPGFTEALAQAAERRGFAFLPDANATDANGVFELPFSNDRHHRASSASVYLSASVRARPNLSISTETQVDTIDFSERRATGISVRRADGSPRRIAARWIVLAAGTIHSAALLLRSGVGPAPDLAALGIRPVADAPGVGRNLRNHVLAHLGAVVRAPFRHGDSAFGYTSTILRASSAAAGAPESDLMLSFLSKAGRRARDNRLGMLGIGLYAPQSIGSVRLNQDRSPDIQLGVLEDAADRARLVAGARLARALLEDADVARTVRETFVLPARLPIRLLNGPGLKSDLLSLVLAGALDGGSLLRRRVLDIGLGGGRRLDSLDDDAFDSLVVASATPMFHPVGTCAIGTVVDPGLKLLGVGNVFVADASVMPRIPRANTNLPTAMIAEKGADAIRERLKTRHVNIEERQ